MPTGYTHPVQEGKITTLRDFALECVRAFLVEYRDYSGPLVAVKEPDHYHYDEIKRLEKELAELQESSEASGARYAEYLNEEDWAIEYNHKKEVSRTRYEAMLEQVNAWDVDDDLANLKNFMTTQLSESIDWDCNGSTLDVEAKKSFESWYLDIIHYTEKEIEYHKAEYEKVLERTNERNAWVAKFLDSLPEE